MKKKSLPFLTITETAKRLKISRQAVHDAIKKGILKAERGKRRNRRLPTLRLLPTNK